MNESKTVTDMVKWITPYSTYLMSKYGTKIEIVTCEYCERRFKTNNGRKRCSKDCAKLARKKNRKLKKNENREHTRE